jgi:hypothetical protein
LKEVVYEVVLTPHGVLTLEHEDHLAVGDIDGEPLEPSLLRIEGRVGSSEPRCLQLGSLL